MSHTQTLVGERFVGIHKAPAVLKSATVADHGIGGGLLAKLVLAV